MNRLIRLVWLMALVYTGGKIVWTEAIPEHEKWMIFAVTAVAAFLSDIADALEKRKEK